ncbi:MAG: molybdopterin-dependent oxidoreductase [Dehalococcoidia bacterium]
MNREQDEAKRQSWLDYRVSRRRVFGLSALAAIGGVMGYRVLNNFGGFRINTVEAKVPAFDKDSYRFVVDGLVEKPLSLSYDQLLALPSVKQVSDFHCVEGWGVKDVRWQGVRLQTIVDMVRPKPEAGFITYHSLDGVYLDSLSVGQAASADALIAYNMFDRPLSPDHGFPLRFIMPHMYGYKGAKFLYRLEFAATQVVGYWEQRGWQINGWIS